MDIIFKRTGSISLGDSIVKDHMTFTNSGQAGFIVSERMDSQRLVSKIEIPEKFHDQQRMFNRGVRNGSHLV